MNAPYLHPTELKKRYSFLAKKWLGQNFLVHRPTLETLAKKILATSPHTLLEIGPGPASLSQLLAPQVKRLVLVEKDEQFKPVLEEIFQEQRNVEILWGDFLAAPLEEIILEADAPCLAVGNLPYNVSVAILQKLLKSRKLFAGFFLMFQREVADRLTAKPNTKAYGSLSLYCQMLADCKIILPIPPSAFDPRPKIDSAVVEFKLLPKTRMPGLNFDFYEDVIQASFRARRKTLLNNLQNFLPQYSKIDLEAFLKQAGIEAKQRAEAVGLENFAKLAQILECRRD